MFYNEEASSVIIRTVEENNSTCYYATCFSQYDLTCFCDYISDKLAEVMEKSWFPFAMRFSPENLPLPSEYPVTAKYDFTNAIFDWNSVRNNT